MADRESLADQARRHGEQLLRAYAKSKAGPGIQIAGELLMLCASEIDRLQNELMTRTLAKELTEEALDRRSLATAEGPDWRLRRDESTGETWLVVDDVHGLRVHERRVEMVLPTELAKLFDRSDRQERAR